MEAANRGALEAGGKSIGLGIKLPEEQKNNKYITPELSLQFYYFFMRKFFLVQPAKATVMFPGGFGTLDELTEILTLKQTEKIQKPMPIVLIGKKFWNTTLNFNYLLERNMIKKEDLNQLNIVRILHRLHAVCIDCCGIPSQSIRKNKFVQRI